MQCPCCSGVNLVMSERQGIEIDYCPQCRGVWLDRGELDKIIERSAVAPASRPPAAGHTPRQEPYHGEGYKKRKKEGFFSDLFDF